jgi:hypothetical protein
MKNQELNQQQLFFISFYKRLLKKEKKISNNKNQEIINLLNSEKQEDNYNAIVQIYNTLVVDKLLDGNDEVIFKFSGSGDSGEIEEIIADEYLEDIFNHDDFDDFKLNNLIGFDWYNNEGGQGDIIINLKDGTIMVEAGWNERTTIESNSTHFVY